MDNATKELIKQVEEKKKKSPNCPPGVTETKAEM